MKHTTMFTLALMLLGLTGVEDLQAQDARSDVQTVLSRMAPNRQLPADLILTGQVTDPYGGTQPFRLTIKGKDQVRYEVGAGTALVTTILPKGRGTRQTEGRLEALKPYSAITAGAGSVPGSACRGPHGSTRSHRPWRCAARFRDCPPVHAQAGRSRARYAGVWPATG